MKANGNQIRAALDAASADIRLYLLHGPDEAGAVELAQRLARRMGPDAERVDFESGQLRAHPGLLADEAASLSLFGGARHIRVGAAGDECVEAAELLLGADRAGNPVVMIAPTLRASSKLVKLALAAPAAMSFACYVPEGDEAEKLAVAIAREQGLRTTGGAAARIVAISGGDRAVMARELEKLALFVDAAPDRPRELDDAAILAVGADLGDVEMSRAIEAVIDGRADTLGAELARLTEAGVSPIPVLRQLVRRLMALAELRAQVDRGTRIDSVIEPVFFRERAATGRALRVWRSDRIAEAIGRARRAERGLMASAGIGTVLAEDTMLTIARMAARQR